MVIFFRSRCYSQNYLARETADNKVNLSFLVSFKRLNGYFTNLNECLVLHFSNTQGAFSKEPCSKALRRLILSWNSKPFVVRCWSVKLVAWADETWWRRICRHKIVFSLPNQILISIKLTKKFRQLDLFCELKIVFWITGCGWAEWTECAIATHSECRSCTAIRTHLSLFAWWLLFSRMLI